MIFFISFIIYWFPFAKLLEKFNYLVETPNYFVFLQTKYDKKYEETILA